MIKRFLAIFLIGLLVVNPASAAPLPIAATTMLFPSGSPNVLGTLPTSSALNTVTSWAPAIVGISAQIGYITMETIFGDMVRIPLTAQNPSSSIPVDGSSLPSTSSPVSGSRVVAGLTDNGTGVPFGSYYYSSNGSSVTACQMACSSLGGDYTTGPTCVAPALAPSGNAARCVTGTATAYCPDGYSSTTSNATNCTLTQPRAALTDKKIDYRRSSTSLSVTLPDPDSSTTGAIKGVVTNGNQIEVSGKDSYGNPVQNVVKVNTDGGSTVTQKVQTADPTTGQTKTTVKTLTVDSSGNVLGYSQVDTADTLTLSGTAQTATVTSAVPSGSTVSASSSGSGTSFPSDYAKTGEAAAAAGTTNAKLDSSNTKLDQLHSDLTNQSDAPGEPGVPNATGFENAFFNGTFSGLSAWHMPSHSSTCPTASFDLTPYFGSGWFLTLDYQCTLAESQRSTVSVAMIVVWVLVAFFIVMGA